jgi:ribose transport system substrate-binding protein
VLSCSQATTNCSVFADAAMAAGRALGWNMTLYDVKYDPSRAVQGVRQAIAAKADGIVTYLADCPAFQQALGLAHSAGVRTSTAESLQCTKPPMYDSIVSYAQGPYPAWLAAWGAAQAQTAIAGTHGNAHVIAVTASDVPTTVPYLAGVKSGIAKCAACDLYDLSITTADIGAGLQQKLGEALLKHPDANVVLIPADALLAGGVEAALRAAGRWNAMFLALGEGDPTVMADLRNGTIKDGIGVGIPEDWEAESAIDNLNRLFGGATPVSSGIGLQAFDATHNVPASGGYQAPIDFSAAYRKIWGPGG